MIEDDEARLVFFSNDDFAETVHVELDETGDTDGQQFDLSVIFNAKPIVSSHFDNGNRFPDHHGARPSGSSPNFRCRASDFPKALAGRATVMIRDRAYSVYDVETDGTGMATVTVKLK